MEVFNMIGLFIWVWILCAPALAFMMLSAMTKN